ncbi:hypothetical protein HYPSUDRAFT_109244, partial [Hypholoma sublateritium FD-334 SS-4]
GLLFGPPLTMWYTVLNRIKAPSPGKGLMYRVFLDQALFAPVAVAFFFGSMSILEGRPDDAFARIQAASLTTLVHSWYATHPTLTRTILICRLRIVYIPTQILNFALIPPHLRAVFVSSVSLFWS